MRIFLGRHLLLQTAAETIRTVQTVCTRLGCRVHHNAETGDLYIESPVHGLVIRLLAQAGKDSPATAVVAALAGRLQAAGARISDPTATGGAGRSDLTMVVTEGGAAGVSIWFSPVSFARNRRVAHALAKALAAQSQAPVDGVRCLWHPQRRGQSIGVQIGALDSDAAALAVAAALYEGLLAAHADAQLEATLAGAETPAAPGQPPPATEEPRRPLGNLPAYARAGLYWHPAASPPSADNPPAKPPRHNAKAAAPARVFRPTRMRSVTFPGPQPDLSPTGKLPDG